MAADRALPVQLRGGFQTLDARLDRIPEFDPRSRAFGIAERLTSSSPVSKTWFFGGAPWRSRQNLDQGVEGACVGFGWTQELITSPAVKRFRSIEQANGYARGVYFSAQEQDEWPGGEYPGAQPIYSGSSVLGGAKVLAARGYIPEYRWAFSIDDLILAVGREGPAVVGTDWTEDMDRYSKNGLLAGASGPVRGGHCYLIRGITLKPKLAGVNEPVFRITNSWGDGWGFQGDAFIRVSDFERLLKAGGEACIPIRRSQGS